MGYGFNAGCRVRLTPEETERADWERELLDGEDRHKAFVEQVTARTDAIRDLLIEKNRKYGNSALDPLRVFSTAGPVETLKVRIDDKLSRIKRGVGDDEDTVTDLIGYLILFQIAKEGTN